MEDAAYSAVEHSQKATSSPSFFPVQGNVWRWVLALLGVGILTAAGIWLTPSGIALYHQERGGQFLAPAMESKSQESTVTFACLYSGQTDSAFRDELKKARGHLERALDFNPALSKTHLLLGRTNCLLGQPEKAISNFLRFTELRPDNPLGYLELGFAYEADCADEPKIPTDRKALFSQWEMCSEKTFQDQMVAAWSAADVKAQHFLDLGNRFTQEQQYSRALAWYARSSLVAAGRAKPWSQAAGIFVQLEDWDNAALFYGEAVARFPNSRDDWYQLGKVYEAKENWMLALQAYEQALGGSGEIGKSNVYYRMGWIYQKWFSPPNFESAWDAYEQALEENDFTGNKWELGITYYQRGLILAQQNDWVDAVEEYEMAISLLPKHYWAHIQISQALWKTNRLERAIQFATMAVEIEPDKKNGYLLLGDIYLAQGNISEARKNYQIVQELDPADEPSSQALKNIEQISP